MLLAGIQFCLLFLTASADSHNLFHKGTSTKKPDIPYEDSPVPKPRKPPVHISEFTDPNTGLNPFLDIEEGPTSAGRNIMKDEHKEDLPFFDFELVEGTGPERQWDLDKPKQPLEEPIQRWPPFESTTIIPHTSQKVSTYTETDQNTPEEEKDPEVKGHKIENEDRTSTFSKDTIVAVSGSVIALVTFVAVVAVCWWKRRVKRTTQTHIAVESGEIDN